MKTAQRIQDKIDYYEQVLETHEGNDDRLIARIKELKWVLGIEG